MKGVAKDIGRIHFVGIGGIGMSGVAEVMHNLGYSVQGSDVAEGYVVQGLRDRGITVHLGHDAANLGDAVVIEKEYGTIEEIGSSFVVVRLWDLRRLIVPLSYFFENHFQNWTFRSSDLVGAVRDARHETDERTVTATGNQSSS